MGHPLRFRHTDDKWATRVMEAGRTVLARPAFAGCSAAERENFLSVMICDLIDTHLTSSLTFEEDPAGWTGYTDYQSFDGFAFGCDLAAAAYEHFILGHTPSILAGARGPAQGVDTYGN